MKRSVPSLACFLLAFVTLAAPALAETGFQFAAPNTRAPDDPEVNGFRLSLLHGENMKQAGVDFGLISLSETTTFSGAAFIMGMAKVKGNMQGGAAFSLVNVHEGTDSGLNAAFINLLNNPTNAVNIGFVQMTIKTLEMQKAALESFTAPPRAGEEK